MTGSVYVDAYAEQMDTLTGDVNYLAGYSSTGPQSANVTLYASAGHIAIYISSVHNATYGGVSTGDRLLTQSI